MCKVSIVIPVYNAEDFLNECLDSLLNQTMKDIEIICVDDGSTDNSANIVEDYVKKDARVRLYRQENLYAGVARNNGFQHAKGEYVLFLDSDDFFEPDMVELSYQCASENNADICVFSSNLYDMETGTFKNYDWAFRREFFNEGEVFSPKEYPYNENIFRMFNGWAWDKLVRSDFIKQHNLEFQALRSTNDMYFTFMALAKAERIITLDKMLVHQRVNIATSISRTRDKSWNNFYLALQAMNNELHNSGLETTYQKAFINWCTNFTLWQLRTLTGKSFVAAYELFNQKALDEFGVSDTSPEDFFSSEEYEKISEVIHTPMLSKDVCEKMKTINDESGNRCCISIIMPSLNVGKYMKQCLESVMNQTFKNIEIICVDAGSTDGTLEIIEECAKKDSRIKVIHSEIKSYGYQMNLGLDAATGDYIGIVETDDFCEPDMFASLYSAAVLSGVDVVKGNYYRYSDDGETFFENFKGIPYGQVISPKENQGLIHAVPSIWTGLYNRKFLLDNDLRFNETPGASYQDTGFIVKVWTCAKKAYIVKKPFYHYRTDNENSSVKSSAKVFCLQDEFISVDKFVAEHLDVCGDFIENVFVRKVEVYKWNFNRLADVFRLDFLYGIRDELINDLKNKPVENAKLSLMQRKFLKGVLESPEEFCFKNQNFDDSDNELWMPEKKEKSTSIKVALIVNISSDELELSKCLKSICKQSMEEIAISCIYSSDTEDSCLQYLRECAKQDKRIEIINLEDKEIDIRSLVNNTEYVYCIESTDVLRRDAIGLLYDTARKEKSQIIIHQGGTYQKNSIKRDFINEEMISESGSLAVDMLDNSLFSVKNHNIYAMLCHKDIIVNILDADYEYFIKCLRSALAFSMASFVFASSICYTDEKLLLHKDTMNATKDSMNIIKTLEMIRDFFETASKYKQNQYSFINYVVKVVLDLFDLMKDKSVRLTFLQYLKHSSLNVEDYLVKMEKLTDDEWKRNKLMGLLQGFEWADDLREKKNDTGYTIIKKAAISFLPKVSVIIPVYNTGKYLGDCLDSIVNQTLGEIEIICVNDGSQDNSLDILSQYAKKDERFTIVDQPNGGQSRARNHALSIARGEYIYFMDSDDRLALNALEELVERASDRNLDVLFFDGTCFYDDDSEELAKKVQNYNRSYNRNTTYADVYTGVDFMIQTRHMDDYRVSPCMQIAKKSLFEKANLHFYEGIIYEDNLYTFQVLLNAERVSAVKEPYYIRRLQNDSTTMQSIGFKHSYGYFICYLEMIKIIRNQQMDDEKIAALYEIANSICLQGAIQKWKQAPVEERFYFYFLPAQETAMFEALVYNSAIRDISAGVARRRLEKNKKQLDKAEKKISKLKMQLQGTKGNIKELKRQLKGIERKYKDSTTMKVGTALMWAPKKAKNLFRKK